MISWSACYKKELSREKAASLPQKADKDRVLQTREEATRMETGSKIDLVESPPVYSISPKGWTPEKKKKFLIISVVVVVLSLILVAAILIGVKMTQDHTEKIFQMTVKNPDGSESQQMATVNKQENVVTFYVTGKNSSSTILYDYSNSLICVRMNSEVCYLTKMSKSNIPSLDSISKSFQDLQSTSAGSAGSEAATLSYTVQKEPVADRSVLGTSINVLCSKVPIQWALESTGSQSRAFCFHVYICYKTWRGRLCGYYYRCR
ncbi:surfactant protein C [Pleurodeles waltl]|uniref:surfactant protein C n=1 Tax=Pleurodeles waltl TaxID=8319 RepID=UPI003709C296